MKHCPNCGHELPAGVKFCPNCGQAIQAAEPSAAKSAEPVESAESATSHLGRAEERSEKLGTPGPPRVATERPLPGKPKPKQNNVIIVAVAAVVVVLAGFFFVKNRVVVSRDRLASNVTKAVQKEDGKLFLKQFSKDDQQLKYSDVGAKSVVKDLHDHSHDSLSEVGRIIVDGERVSGTEVKYRFSVESKTVLGLFTSYYLTTRRTPVHVADYTSGGGPVILKLKEANDERVTKSQLSSGFFPGKYNFNVTSGDYQGSYWIWAAGDGDTIDLTLTDD